MVDFPFDENIAAQCSLLMSIEPDRFSYAVVSQENRKLKAIFEVKRPLDDVDIVSSLVNADDILQLPFLQTRVCLFTHHNTFIPNELYREEYLASYARLVTPRHGDTLIASSMQKAQCKAVFSVDSDYYKWFTSQYPNIQFHFQGESFVQSLIVQYGLTGISAAFINVLSPKLFELAILNEGKFVFYNSYAVENNEEFLYFVLATCKQLKLDSSALILNMSGEVDPHSDISQILLQYFSQVQIISSVNFLDIPITFSNIPIQRFFSLLGLFLCG